MACRVIPSESMTLAARSTVSTVLCELGPELQEFVRRRAGGTLEPAEVVQQVAARALEHANELREPSRARAWLFRIARNALADRLRRRGRAPALEPLEGEDAATASPDEPPCWCILTQAKELKVDYAQVLEHVVIQGQPLAEFAAEVGISVNNATVRLHRARAALRERLRAHCGTCSPRSCSDCGCEERGCCPRPT